MTVDERLEHHETMLLNMGPQHPSTHGVLRLMLELDGEVVVDAHPDIGFLHTGIEKSCEYRTYHQAITLTDRIDYLSPYSNNLAYVNAVEKIFGVTPPPRASWLRVLIAELHRIGSHLLWLGTTSIDLAASSMLIYCFREREDILRLMEEISGVRMMTSFIRIGGLPADVTPAFLEGTRRFLDAFPEHLAEYDDLLRDNPIFRQRMVGIGKLSANDALRWSVTGPNLRASGVDYDVRRALPYEVYPELEFDIPTETAGDAYARYLVRRREMDESVRICRQVLDRLPDGPIRIDDPLIAYPKRELIHRSMESLIHHYKLATDGPIPPPGQAYSAVESPRGEFGAYVVSNGTNLPQRVRFRAPSFANLQALPLMIRGHMVADCVAALASIDFVLGEIDR
ncbi:MAG TPA: NADH-quinone oxidoreductase subunit D [Candidatus Acidoferrales bacterium]|nr:NADH-quinone oxidoreductase subunit D [Candidatus Acidoferrales bacterium]